jgi:hypothetical protein
MQMQATPGVYTTVRKQPSPLPRFTLHEPILNYLARSAFICIYFKIWLFSSPSSFCFNLLPLSPFNLSPFPFHPLPFSLSPSSLFPFTLSPFFFSSSLYFSPEWQIDTIKSSNFVTPTRENNFFSQKIFKVTWCFFLVK